jgi:predicted DNA-binding protein (UPF0251 family)
MAPRPIKSCKISNIPPISGFKPYGNKEIEKAGDSIFLHFEEYESIRLCDYQMLNHDEASVIMGVSRPTLTRIYGRARQKIAEAMVVGKQIIIEGGKVHFDSDWHHCEHCGAFFNHLDKTREMIDCPLCGSRLISSCMDISEADIPNYLTCKGPFRHQHQKQHKNETCHHKRR